MNRRTFLASATVAAGSCGLAGCLGQLGLGSEGSAPEPVDLSGKFDDDHGMEIGPHGGANAQIFYEGETPPDRDGPFWFHTLVFSAVPFHFDRRDRGWETAAFYVTDFSAVDWTVQERDGTPAMPSPTAPETFADATEMTYVAESDVMGGMGPGLHPFAEASDADAFVADHGGETLSFDDVDRALVGSLREGGQDH